MATDTDLTPSGALYLTPLTGTYKKPKIFCLLSDGEPIEIVYNSDLTKPKEFFGVVQVIKATDDLVDATPTIEFDKANGKIIITGAPDSARVTVMGTRAY